MGSRPTKTCLPCIPQQRGQTHHRRRNADTALQLHRRLLRRRDRFVSIARPHDGVCGRYVKRVYDSSLAKSYFETRANGLTRVGLSQKAIEALPFPLPPPADQRAIAAFLDRETAKLDVLVEKPAADRAAEGKAASGHLSCRHPRPRPRRRAQIQRHRLARRNPGALGGPLHQLAKHQDHERVRWTDTRNSSRLGREVPAVSSHQEKRNPLRKALLCQR